MNIIIPMSGAGLYEASAGGIYPKILTEVAGKTLLEHALTPFAGLGSDARFIFMVPKIERKALSLDAIIKIVVPGEYDIIDINGDTGGALCTCLLALDTMNADDELIISSADHHLSEDISAALAFYRESKADAGVLTFESVHPKWSYALLNERAEVRQTSEKLPISRHAMAGFFYFRHARDFIEAAKSVIRKQNQINGQYFVSSTINEMILAGQTVLAKPLAGGVYYNFYDSHSIKVFEHDITLSRHVIEEKSRAYVHAFHAMDLDSVMNFFDDDATLIDPGVNLSGKAAIRDFLTGLFASVKKINFIEKNILVDGEKSVIEFELQIDDQRYIGTDVIQWQAGKISALRAYLYQQEDKNV